MGPGGQFEDARCPEAVVTAEAPSLGGKPLRPARGWRLRARAAPPRAPRSSPAAKPRRRLGLEQTRGVGTPPRRPSDPPPPDGAPAAAHNRVSASAGGRRGRPGGWSRRELWPCLLPRGDRGCDRGAADWGGV